MRWKRDSTFLSISFNLIRRTILRNSIWMDQFIMDKLTKMEKDKVMAYLLVVMGIYTLENGGKML